MLVQDLQIYFLWREKICMPTKFNIFNIYDAYSWAFWETLKTKSFKSYFLWAEKLHNKATYNNVHFQGPNHSQQVRLEDNYIYLFLLPHSMTQLAESNFKVNNLPLALNKGPKNSSKPDLPLHTWIVHYLVQYLCNQQCPLSGNSSVPPNMADETINGLHLF